MTPDRRRQLAYVFLLTTPALWSVNYLVARSAPGIILPHMLAFWRWSLAGGLLAALACAPEPTPPTLAAVAAQAGGLADQPAAG